VDLGCAPSWKLGAPKNTFLQFNVVNVFNKFYTGGFDGSSAAYYASNPDHRLSGHAAHLHRHASVGF
jgi:hypothetical protein